MLIYSKRSGKGSIVFKSSKKHDVDSLHSDVVNYLGVTWNKRTQLVFVLRQSKIYSSRSYIGIFSDDHVDLWNSDKAGNCIEAILWWQIKRIQKV